MTDEQLRQGARRLVAAGVRVNTIATKAGVSHGAVAMWLSGSRVHSATATACGIAAEELLRTVVLHNGKPAISATMIMTKPER